MRGRRLKIVNPKRLIAGIALIAAVILLIVWAAGGFSSASGVQKYLEEKHASKIRIVNAEIKSSVASGSEVNPNDIITFNAEYKYSLENSNEIKTHTVTEEMKINVKDASSITSLINSNTSVQIGNAVEKKTEIEVAVSFEDLEKTFKYTVLPDSAQNTETPQ